MKNLFLLIILSLAFSPLVGQENYMSTKLLKKEWTEFQFGTPAMAIDIPVTMEKMEVPLPEEILKYIVSMETEMYQSGENLMISSSAVLYNETIIADLQGAANGAIQEMKNMGVTDIKYEEELIEIGGIEGIRQEGTFNQFGSPFVFTNTIISKRSNLWQLMIANNPEDKDATIMRNRIQKSMRVK